MASGFAPEFLILLGIDIFLGASILAVLLDKHFPTPLPYVLEGAALIGFAELMAGPTFLTSFSQELQFYYSFAYAMISVLTLFATNLYLLFLRRRPFESAILGICATIPSSLGILYFTSAFVNGLSLSLPLVPVIPIEGVYALFGISIGLVVFSMVVFGRRKPVEPVSVQERSVMDPIISRATPDNGQVLLTEAPAQSGQGEAVTEAATAQPEGVSGSVASPAERRSDVAGKGDHHGGGDGVGLPSGVTGASHAGSEASPIESRKDEETRQPSGTVLVKRVERTEYAKRLVDSIKFFEKAVDHPVRIDPSILGGTLKGARKAYLTPSGMLMVEDKGGRSISLSLLDLSTDEALQVMREAMKDLKGMGDLP
jgi:hypothetical protein